jgi:hypothetical protein
VKARETLTEMGGWGVYVCLLLFCGVALIFSMPWATYVRELQSAPWRPSAVVFFFTYAMMMSIVGLNRGAALAEHGRVQWRRIAKVAQHIVLAQILVSPYLVHVRVLLPGKEATIALLALYVTVLGLFHGLAAHQLEASSAERGRESFVLRYGLTALFFGLPMLGLLAGKRLEWIPLLSPFGAVAGLLHQVSWARYLVPFLPPVVLGAAVLVMTARKIELARSTDDELL